MGRYDQFVDFLANETIPRDLKDRIACAMSSGAFDELRNHDALALAVRLLEQGTRRATIAHRLMAEYSVSRSTSYRLIGQALVIRGVHCRPGIPPRR
jgi:hypothetical protein